MAAIQLPSVVVNLFDLDGVLTHGDMVTRLVVQQFRTEPNRLLRAIPTLVRRQFVRGLAARQACNRQLVQAALRGLSPSAYPELARRMATELAHEAGFACQDGLSRLRAALDDGPTLIVTACEETLAVTYLAHFGITAPLLGSTVNYGGRGAEAFNHNIGRAKVALLSARGIDVSGAVLFTDSLSDLPMARLVQRTELINPDPETAAAFAAESLEHTIQQWR